MKRPISILCMADVHYHAQGDNMRAVDSLYSELVKYIDADRNRIKWLPDYIVIAGDVANQNGGYENVSKFIENLRSENAFNIAADHVIVVPGNHDKNAKGPSTQHSADRKVFEQIQHCEKLSSKDVNKFGDTFEPRFKEYIEFCKPYTSDLQFNENGTDCVLDERLRCLSGVKVFADDDVCFLYVNTEWLYVSGREKAKVSSHNGDDFSEFVRLDEDCQLCAPLIKDACTLIREKYPTHTIITVMHRGFEHLSWKEKNPTDAALIDSVGYLIKTSDIIISGHDHVFSPAPPTLIGNRVQHFQLGAVGRKEPKTTEFQRWAEIIRLDVSNEKVEQLFVQYKNTDGGFLWCFEESQKNYPLFAKHLSKTEHSKVLPFFHDTILVAKWSGENDIKRSISTYFRIPPAYKLQMMAADLDISNRLEKLVGQLQNPLYIVVYYRYQEYIEGISIHSSPIRSIKQALDRFRDEHIKILITHQIIINEVVVDYPIENI